MSETLSLITIFGMKIPSEVHVCYSCHFITILSNDDKMILMIFCGKILTSLL